MTKPELALVSLTQSQRNVISELLSDLADYLTLDEKNPRTISFTPKELGATLERAEAARPNAQNGMNRNSLRHIIDAVTKPLEKADGIGAIPGSERLYQ